MLHLGFVLHFHGGLLGLEAVRFQGSLIRLLLQGARAGTILSRVFFDVVRARVVGSSLPGGLTVSGGIRGNVPRSLLRGVHEGLVRSIGVRLGLDNGGFLKVIAGLFGINITCWAPGLLVLALQTMVSHAAWIMWRRYLIWSILRHLCRYKVHCGLILG